MRWVGALKHREEDAQITNVIAAGDVIWGLTNEKQRVDNTFCSVVPSRNCSACERSTVDALVRVRLRVLQTVALCKQVPVLSVGCIYDDAGETRLLADSLRY